MEEETVLCGNTSTGITQSTDNKLHLYSDDHRVLSVEPTLLKVYARISGVKGSNAVAANVLNMPLDGTLFHVVGNTNIKYISTTNWTAGSSVVLIFKNILIVDSNAPNAPVNSSPIYLNAGLDFLVRENSILNLVYDGEAWFELSRKL